MPGETPSQPGWYPDQNGTMRWFDGAAWTDHVQPGAGRRGPRLRADGGPAEHARADPAARAAARLAGRTAAREPAGGTADPGRRRGCAGVGVRRRARSRRSPVAPVDRVVPRPGFPPPSSGGGNKGLLIILAVVGAIVLIAVLAVGSWAVFVRDSDDSDCGDNGSGNSSLPDTSPEDVVEGYVQAIKDGDCEAALALLSEEFIAEEEANCEDEEDFMTDEEFEYEVGEATIDEDAETAVVPFSVTAEGVDEDFPIGLVVEDDEWKIDSFEVGGRADGRARPISRPISRPTCRRTSRPTCRRTSPTSRRTSRTSRPTSRRTRPSWSPTCPTTSPTS